MRPKPDRSLELQAFAPAEALKVRRHGPRGYVDDDHYKPWLRDEFTYRCLYCGCREVWFPDGDRSFSVEHVQPTSLAPEGLTEYDTLVYACCQCNGARGATLLPLDPTAGLRQHLEVSADGTTLCYEIFLTRGSGFQQPPPNLFFVFDCMRIIREQHRRFRPSSFKNLQALRNSRELRQVVCQFGGVLGLAHFEEWR